MTSNVVRFKARIAKSGKNWHICVPIPLREMVRHGDEYLVTLEPLEEGEEHG